MDKIKQYGKISDVRYGELSAGIFARLEVLSYDLTKCEEHPSVVKVIKFFPRITALLGAGAGYFLPGLFANKVSNKSLRILRGVGFIRFRDRVLFWW